MTLATTFTWQIDVGEIIEEAYEKSGLSESYTGYDFNTARRSLNLILTDWVNRGVNLWLIDLVTQALVVGTATYTLASETVDVLDAVWRVSGIDTPLERLGLQEYLKSRSDKTASGTPNAFAIERQSDGGHTMYVWPTPNATDSIIYWRIRYPYDVSTTGGNQTVDVPRRFLPALTAGLAYELALKKNVALDRLGMLKAEYETSLQRAMDEDRERSSLFIVPVRGRW